MKKIFFGRPVITRACMFVLAVFVVTSCNKNSDHWLDSHKAPYQLNNFAQTNLVANSGSYNPVTIDPLLINGWGLAFSPTGVAWPGSQGGHVGPVYNSEGMIARPAVTIPSPGGNTGGNPSGVVFNGSTDFALPEPNNQAARFIFVGLDGILSGWNAAAGNSAVLVKNNSSTAVYTGLAIASIEGSGYLYASNFKAGTVDVFDKNFNPVWMPFKDPGIPEGYAPFNIQAIGNWLYVAYAKVGLDGRDVPGKGNGYVSVFTKNGNFVKRFASRGQLNAPWGIARTPSTFFDAGQVEKQGLNAILVGNFGDGRINAYTADGSYLGELANDNKPVVIPGLWAISFVPPTATAIDSNRLYFAAGPRGELDGLFGYLNRQKK